MAKITAKQKRFADEYLIDLNATQAAKRAGYKDPNFGRQLLTKKHVSAYIQERRSRLQKKFDVSQDRVIGELAKIGFAKLTDFLSYRTVMREVGKDDNGMPIHDWAMIVDAIESERVDSSPIQEVSVARDGTFKFKLYSKLDALEKLGRYLNLFAQDTNLDEANAKLDKLLEGIDHAAKR